MRLKRDICALSLTTGKPCCATPKGLGKFRYEIYGHYSYNENL